VEYALQRDGGADRGEDAGQGEAAKRLVACVVRAGRHRRTGGAVSPSMTARRSSSSSTSRRRRHET
jgi:hypothetical protein